MSRLFSQCICVILLSLQILGTAGLPTCSQLLSNREATTSNEWKAILTIPVPKQPNAHAIEGWHVKITFSQAVHALQHNATDATTSTVDDRNFIMRMLHGVASDCNLVIELTATHDVGVFTDIDIVSYNNMPVCNVSRVSIVPQMKDLHACLDLMGNVKAFEQPGEWKSILSIPVPSHPNAAMVKGWHLKLTFDHPIDQLSHNATGATMTTVDDRNFIMRNPHTTSTPLLNLVLKLHAKHSSDFTVRLLTVKFNNVLVCNGSSQYDYAAALTMSLLFLEAQQSGPLPLDKRIPWRGDSCMNDRGTNGDDISGGYFTGSIGRTVKFTFPNAAANTIFAWSMIDHESAYKAAEEYINGLVSVEWGAKYISKCYVSCHEIYAIVGDQINEASEIWGRPEDINYPRPALSLSSDNPGSDMFGEMVAALASASIVLKSHWEGPELSANLLNQARKLFELAVDNRGDYIRALLLLTNTPVYTPLNGDECELIWASTWMYRATNEVRYLQLAEKFYKKLNFRHRRFTYFYWYDKAVGAMILLYQITKNEDYAYDARIFCDTIANNASLHTSQGTIKGIGKYASGLQLGSWASYACLELGETLVRHGAETSNPYIDFALRNINYILGDSGQSFMVGFGKNYPLKPNHIASLCAPPPAPCNRAVFESDVVNYHVLYGALVFGPDEDGRYEDLRRGVHNNVDIIGNAGLSASLTALLDLRAAGKIS